MKGTVVYKKEDQWQDKTYYKVKLQGIEKDYSCWQKAFASVKIGDEIEYTEEEKNGRWKLLLNSAGLKPFTGGRAKSPEEIDNQLKSFSMSYAKDLEVALINAGKFPGENIMRELLCERADRIYNWFKGKQS